LFPSTADCSLNYPWNKYIFPDGQSVQQNKILKYESEVFIPDFCKCGFIQPGKVRAAKGDSTLLKGDVA